jgi:hypothetical protein
MSAKCGNSQKVKTSGKPSTCSIAIEVVLTADKTIYSGDNS